MRLQTIIVERLIQALDPFLASHSAELRLFGSRVNDNLRGGDIDLLLLVEDQNLLMKLTDNKHYLLAAIKATIGEQKIDLKIACKNEIASDPFLKLIYPDSVVLKRWV